MMPHEKIQQGLRVSSRLALQRANAIPCEMFWAIPRTVLPRSYDFNHPRFGRHSLDAFHGGSRISSELVLQSPRLSCTL
jgi:hypothetical protein